MGKTEGRIKRKASNASKSNIAHQHTISIMSECVSITKLRMNILAYLYFIIPYVILPLVKLVDPVEDSV